MRLFWELDLFSVFFLLREPYTVHKTAYGDDANQALALLPVGIEASFARRRRKRMRIRIRIFADFGRKRPSGESIRLRPSLIPLDARAGFCPWKRFFGPSNGLSSFWGMFVAIRSTPCRRGRQGFDFQAMTGNEMKNGLET